VLTLDLHGIKHVNVEGVLRDFLNFADLPCTVVTGNSSEMKHIVKCVVQEYGWHCYEKNTYNFGALTIVEKKI
jgi:hypothetical protein